MVRHTLIFTILLLDLPLRIGIFILPFSYVPVWSIMNKCEPTEFGVRDVSLQSYVGFSILIFALMLVLE